MFPCNSCGLCCQSLTKNPSLSFLDRGDGTCEHFNTTSLMCKIYLNRPDICRVDFIYDKYFKETLNKSDFYKKNVEVCLSLQKNAGVPKHLRIQSLL